uniref:Putative secreted salivary protein n=1 Tax=Ixodes scapularis TaxID=6945 RepID=Q4PMR1_IXOSC|nr:putative secreted salivary protein [Ixodes scapularis]
MQLAFFMVILTLTYLSCEVQSESNLNIFGDMKYLPHDCKHKLKEQIQNECSGHTYQPLVIKVTDCTYTCGNEHENFFIQTKTNQTFNMKDGTPCGHSRVCVSGVCVDTCRMSFV